jgi:hypothetical protein
LRTRPRSRSHAKRSSSCTTTTHAGRETAPCCLDADAPRSSSSRTGRNGPCPRATSPAPSPPTRSSGSSSV